MAKIEISSWEIAEKLGLEFVRREDSLDKYGDDIEVYTFKFHSKTMEIEHNHYSVSNAETAKEEAAERVLHAIGKMVAENIYLA